MRGGGSSSGHVGLSVDFAAFRSPSYFRIPALASSLSSSVCNNSGFFSWTCCFSLGTITIRPWILMCSVGNLRYRERPEPSVAKLGILLPLTWLWKTCRCLSSLHFASLWWILLHSVKYFLCAFTVYSFHVAPDKPFYVCCCGPGCNNSGSRGSMRLFWTRRGLKADPICSVNTWIKWCLFPTEIWTFFTVCTCHKYGAGSLKIHLKMLWRLRRMLSFKVRTRSVD